MLVAVRDGKLSFIDAALQCSKLAPPQALEWFMNYLHRLVTSDPTSQGNQKIYLFSDRLHLMHAMILSGSNVNQQLLWEELLMSWAQVFSNR